MARRRPIGWLLLIAFVVVPIIEIYVLIQVGQVIGPWWTIVLLVLDSAVGSWLIKREGGRTFRALRTAMQSGRMPGDELADGALILIGGTLMLSPGFVLDILGLVLILPLTRPLFRGVLSGVVARRLISVPDAARPGGRSDGTVVQGEVVDD
ncbi:MAG: FxsA family protein [Nocardioides sp.]